MIITAAGLDLLIGDPRWCPHPVELMGAVIKQLRHVAEAIAGNRPVLLRVGGVLITAVLISGSGALGWAIERLALQEGIAPAWLGIPLLVIALASALAAGSLRHSILKVLKALPTDAGGDLSIARLELSWIVGRDVSQLNKQEILRATAESAAENAVDGVFAPLFWMLIGAGLWHVSNAWPGPLALAWSFKASSTLDSMLGYRQGKLQWLGTAGARLDDLLTWLPCRLVMLTLPLISKPWRQLPALVMAAEQDGALDHSPNAGRSEAIYAHCAGVRMGGRNRYGNRWVDKPLLAIDQPPADQNALQRILALTSWLELVWIMIALVLL
ncbi:adenosylcobinamide-phosphate synthase CbiB [Prochlorococcus sp. MIT 1306]|uniref:adenosylcobinamide-phosphate synthase CbiB n=1 Tax=Prochlorococcus sp. MIT 1306 TaxID=1799667 RepID=UPI0007B31BE0|nr:adenosylcobinamide-phosphate synthase CbiB [Prochlorococcus sp. MIT 1306]KZR65019.1 Cobalamin biosynthesis protein CbiB [Prochlorococcus sp. MIT 1306]